MIVNVIVLIKRVISDAHTVSTRDSCRGLFYPPQRDVQDWIVVGVSANQRNDVWSWNLPWIR